MDPTCPPSRFQFASRSDTGRVRARNEDRLQVAPERGWAVLADGMGGYRGGDVAAALAVAQVMQGLEAGSASSGGIPPDCVSGVLRRSVEAANTCIFRASLADPDLSGMGATVVAAVFLPGRLFCAHAGDSRLYRFRDGKLSLLTRDHSTLQEFVNAGLIEEDVARRAHFRGMLTRGLGVVAEVDPEMAEHDIEAGDLYLMCSDGLTDMLADEEVENELARELSPEQTVQTLVELANRRGGRDNISVIVVRPPG